MIQALELSVIDTLDLECPWALVIVLLSAKVQLFLQLKSVFSPTSKKIVSDNLLEINFKDINLSEINSKVVCRDYCWW